MTSNKGIKATCHFRNALAFLHFGNTMCFLSSKAFELSEIRKYRRISEMFKTDFQECFEHAS